MATSPPARPFDLFTPAPPSWSAWLLHPEDARLQDRLLNTQRHLGRLAAAHTGALETSAFYPGLGEKLLRAQQFEELATALDRSRIAVTLDQGRIVAPPEARGLLERFNQALAHLLERLGERVSHTGHCLEASLCRQQAAELYEEVGAILSLEYLIQGREPRWALAVMIEVRHYTRELAAREAQRVQPGRMQKLQRRIHVLHEKYGDVLSREDYAWRLDDEGSRIRPVLVEFTAWGVQTYGSLGAFLAMLPVAAFREAGAWGNVLVSAVLHIALKYRRAVQQLVPLMPSEREFQGSPLPS